MSNAEFLADIERNLVGLQFFSVGGNDQCSECPNGEEWEESFSGRSCDSCGSGLAGNRIPAHAFLDGELVHMEVCSDCAMYHANGELPYDD